MPQDSFASQVRQKVREKKGGERGEDAFRASEKEDVDFWLVPLR